MTDRALHLTPNESVVIRSLSPDALEVERTWGPGGSPPPKHFHPAQEERFEVLEGTLRARVEGQEHTLSAGQTLHVPRGAVHQTWNEGSEPSRAIWVTSPAGRTAHGSRPSPRPASRGHSITACTSPSIETSSVSRADSRWCSERCGSWARWGALFGKRA
jgi:quercetin dioxygenase-like cupin family protein